MRKMVSKHIPTIKGCSLLCFTILVAIMLSLAPFPVKGETKTITHTVKQPSGGSQSSNDAHIAATAKAKREALEMAGTYVEGLAVVKYSRVDKDEILALTAGALKAEVVSQKYYRTEEALGVEVTVRIDVDTSILEDRVKKLLADRAHLEDLNQARKKEKALLNKIVKLQQENKRLTKNKNSATTLKEQFRAASQGLTALDWFYKAKALWQNNEYTDPKKAIEYLNNAIRLKPDLAEAYNNRGAAYGALGQYKKTIEDYNKAIRFKPDYAGAYNNRGILYGKLGQHSRAIENYNKAIRLKPDYAEAYNNRGIAYDDLAQRQRAIEDYNTAIRLKPDYASAYNNRGILYGKLGQYLLAIEDYNTAIRLKPDYAEAYNNRGIAYGKLGQYPLAIEDYNTAIRLKPDYVGSYNNRGAAYLEMGSKSRGCSDVQKACSMGTCRAYEWAKSKGDCLY